MGKVSAARACERCGVMFQPNVWNQKRCSSRCTVNAAKDRSTIRKRGGVLPLAAPCTICGSQFKPYSVVSRYCSKRCRSRAKDAHRRYRVQSKRAAVIERDGGICQLCSNPVDMALPYPHPKAATLDHIVPVSAGGSHDLSNLQLAHMDCNAGKGGAPRWRRPDLILLKESE